MNAPRYLSVSILNTYIHNVFVAEELLHGIDVVGEVSGISVVRGHAYFTLKDRDAQIACNSFNCSKTYLPKNGELIIVRGSVSYYGKNGKLSLNADVITPYGAGLLALKLEELKNRLAKEGIFDASHKKPLPKYPASVCVLTSTSGAVIRDIITTVRRYNDLIDINVYGVQVQGENSAESIVKALAVTDKLGFDVIIIARGGGSAEDLMPFNDEALVRSVYAANTPVISAVGHETDYTLCDLVADVRAATPTAAAELVAYDLGEIKRYLSDFAVSAKKILEDKVRQSSVRLSMTSARMLSAASALSAAASAAIGMASGAMTSAADSLFKAKVSAYEKSLFSLSAANPVGILEKGFFTVNRGENRIKDLSELTVGDKIILNSKRGSAQATVERVEITDAGLSRNTAGGQ